MFNVQLFLLHQWSPNALDIVEQSLSFNVPIQHWVVLLQSMQVLLPDAESSALRVGLVNEQRSTVKASLILPNHCFTWVADFKLHFFVYFITDVIESFLDKNYFVNIIKLRKDYEVLLKFNWIKILQKLDHEILVLDISPRVETIFIGA